jgi:hypothetical protein
MHRIVPYALALALIAVPALADEPVTNDPVELSKQAKGPPPQLSDQQRAAIQQALATENTQQKTPPNFQPQVGAALPGTMTVDVMPPKLVEQDRSLQPYGYAKTAKDVLVVDPTKKTIVAILPRQDPTGGKDLAPAEWAKTKGRELTGQAPEQPTAQDHSPEPAGDTGDKKNGNEKNANEK